MKLQNKKVLVFGTGISGIAAVKLLEDVAQNDGQRKIEKGRQRRAGQQRVAFACRAIHLRSRSVRHDDHTRFRVISYFSL